MMIGTCSYCNAGDHERQDCGLRKDVKALALAALFSARQDEERDHEEFSAAMDQLEGVRPIREAGPFTVSQQTGRTSCAEQNEANVSRMDEHAAAEIGLVISCKLVQDFQKKCRTSEVQRLPQVDAGIDESLQMAAAIMACQAEELLRVAHNGDMRLLRAHLMLEELAELLTAMRDCNEIETLDALADLTYVVQGTAVTLDLPLSAAFVEVHKSNMTKMAANEDNGRVMDKGPDYVPPDIERVLREHRLRTFVPHDYSYLRGECLNCGMSESEIFDQLDKSGKANCKGGLGQRGEK